MSKNIRIRTTPNSSDNHVKVQLNQDFDFLEILSLKISQEDVYRSFYSDYGVVVGRVIMNSGIGVPNARISVFIPLTDEDAQNPELSELYPYKDLQDLNSDGIRYNTLPKDSQGECHVPIGTFPTKRELIDNDGLLEIYRKYFKYTTTTNGAGDFMLFGVPVGNHTINVDVDLSDIGIFSQRPYDFIDQGNPKKLFESPTKFRSNTNLNNLTQVKNRQVGVNVIPFWGEKESNEIGISRIDIDLNYNIVPKAIFIGSIFGDNEKDSLNKNCRPRRGMGQICGMGEGEGTIQMLRKSIFGDNERYDVDGGRVITENGTWAYQIPMNLDYVITNEFGELIPTEDTTKGIPTRARVRFKINLDQTGGEGRLRSRANYLVPHNPENNTQVDYSFDDSTADTHFRDLYWNKIYTVKNYISRYQKNKNDENRNFIGFKDVDDCVGTKSPPPYNKMDTKFNPIYVVICLIISIILEIMGFVNKIISIKFLGIRPFCRLRCIRIECDGNFYSPRCSSRCSRGGSTSFNDALDCFQITLALALNIFKLDFYNDWLNGALYAFLFKYKKPRNSNAKYCGDGNGDTGNYILNTNAEPNGRIEDKEINQIDEGVIASSGGELFYKPLTGKGHKFYSTDLYNLGAVFSCDWQQQPKIQPFLIGTSYQLPPLTTDSDDDPTNDVTSIEPLLFKLTCTKVDANLTQSKNIRRLCEIGVGLDEYVVVGEPDDPNNPNGDDIKNDGFILDNDIENELLRDNLIKLNNPNYYFTSIDNIDSGFGAPEYEDYRQRLVKAGITQFFGNSYYFYFGAKPNNSAVELMNSKYFTDCTRIIKNEILIIGDVSNVSSVKGNDGKIETIVNGGVLPYKVIWYNNEQPNIIIGDEESVNGGLTSNGGLTITGLTEGTYTIQVKDDDGKGMTTSKIFIVYGLQDLMVDVEPINSLPNQYSGKLIFNSITGGVGPYDIEITGDLNGSPYPNPYIINDVPYALTIDGLGEGVYNITVTDSNNDAIDGPDTFFTAVTINTPAQLIVTHTTLNPTCEDFEDGEVEVTIQGGTPEYQITLTDSNNVIYYPSLTTGGTYLFTGLAGLTYELKVVDNFDFTNTQTIILVNPNELVLSWNSEGTTTRRFTLSNTIAGVSYDFLNENDTIIQTVVASGPVITFTKAPYTNVSGTQAISETGCLSNTI